MKLKRIAPGLYESSEGHMIDRIGGRWFITWPGQRRPDVERPTLREAWAYVQIDPTGGN